MSLPSLRKSNGTHLPTRATQVDRGLGTSLSG